MVGLRDEATTGFRWSATGTILSTLLRFAVLAVLARLLQPEAFGLLGMVMALAAFGAIFGQMGLSDATIQDQELPHRHLDSVYWLNLGFAVLAALALVAARPLIVGMYGEPRLSGLVVWVAVTLVVSAVGQQFHALLRKQLRFRDIGVIQIVDTLVDGAVAIALAASGFGVYSLIWGHLAGASARTVMLCIRAWSIWHPKARFRVAEVRGHLRFGVYQFGGSLANELNGRISQILIGVTLGAEALGYFNLAYRLVLEPVSRVTSTVNSVMFPVYSRLQNDAVRLKRWVFTTVRMLSLTNGPIVVGLAAVAPLAIPLLFGDEWQEAVEILQILSVVAALRSTGSPIGSLVLAKGRSDTTFRWNVALVVFQVPGIWLGAQVAGITGVAAAMAMLQVLYAGAGTYYFLVRPFLGRCGWEYAMTRVPAFACSAAMGLLVLAISPLTTSFPEAARLAVLTAAGIVVYMGLAALFLRMDIRMLSSILRRGGPSATASRRSATPIS